MFGARRRVKAGVLAVTSLLVAATAASAETLTFTLPANPVAQPFQRWTVPAGVCSATFDLFGAEGSTTAGGAEVTATLPVVPGTPLDIYIGGEGFRGKGGYNGGGPASNKGVGGGGATDVRDGPGLADRILVAGGGGGNGGEGDGVSQGMAGVGGLLGQNGTQSDRGYYSGGGGSGGTLTSGGAAGFAGPPAPTYSGSPGTLGIGGAGGVPSSSDTGGEGGGGGGGYYGGGGGGSGGAGYPGGGGGGGSSLVAGGTVSMFPHSGNGRAVITYKPSSCPGSPGTGNGDTTKPTFADLSFSRTTFRAARSGGSIARAQLGSQVSFNLSEASSVKFTVRRKTTGRRVRGKCRPATRSNRRARACTRWKAVSGSFTVAGQGGTDTFTFRGRVGGKTLRPGSYRLSGQATDPANNTSLPHSKGFRIVR
jgi:Glycine rich protein